MSAKTSAPDILILSHPDDLHAFAVAEGLRIKGADPLLWCTPDFPSLSGESVTFDPGCTIKVKGPEFERTSWGFDTVWYRRPLCAPRPSILHPADRLFAKNQCETFRRSLFDILCPQSFWVNPARSSWLASQKLFQLHAAIAAGLDTGATLFTNDPDEIRSFLAAHPQGVIFKTLSWALWRDDETDWVPYTKQITEADLVEDSLLRQTPSIFQELLPKDYELRVTIFGRQVFAAKVLSQQTETGRLDWRRSYHELKMEPTLLPERVAGRCFELMDRLGIVFGCFDFVVTPDGRHVFLEVNEAGQFLFIEHYTGMPLLDAFCDFLLQADPRFEWREGADCLRFDALLDRAKSLSDETALRHVRVPTPSYFEGSREEDTPSAEQDRRSSPTG
jgi:hypothetical protein